MSNSPTPVHNNSRSLTSRATKMPAPAVMPRADTDIRKPPSRPPSCRGMKNNRLANSDVNANISTQCR